MKLRFAFIFSFLFCTQWLNAQVLEIVLDEIAEHNGIDNPGIPNGYSTYRMYALMQDPDDQITGIAALASCNEMSITTNGGSFFNEIDHGSAFANEINPALFSDFPELEYDSWLSIGIEDNTSPGLTLGYSELEPGIANLLSFNSISGEDYVIEDGVLFTLSSDSNSYPIGEDNRVLLGQFTTNGEIEYAINLVWINGEDGISRLANWNENSGDCDGILCEEFVCALNSQIECPESTENFSCDLAYPLLEFELQVGDFFGKPQYEQEVECWTLAQTEGFGRWYSFDYDSGSIEIETSYLGSDTIDTMLAIYDACEGTLIRCDQNGGEEEFTSKVQLDCNDLIQGNEYFIQVIQNHLDFSESDCTSRAFQIELRNFSILGCTVFNSINFDPCATEDDDSCISSFGCTDPDACNFQYWVTQDDGSCWYTLPCYPLGDFNSDGIISNADLHNMISLFSCIEDCYMGDLNNDGIINSLDLLIFLSWFSIVYD